MSEDAPAHGELTVAGIQMACEADRDANFSKALDLARVAADRGAKIVCFAECFAWPWFPRKAVEEQRRLAVPIPGPYTQALQFLAEETGAVLVAPMFETADDSAYAIFILEDGTVAQFNSSWCTRVRRDDLVIFQVDGTHGSAIAVGGRLAAC